jgi:hypothetical protein
MTHKVQDHDAVQANLQPLISWARGPAIILPALAGPGYTRIKTRVVFCSRFSIVLMRA